MRESDLQRGVIDLAHRFGWRVAHFLPAQTSRGWRTPVSADGAGFPDLVLLRGARAVVAELKAERGRLSPEQTEWLAAFGMTSVETHTWRPVDYPDRILEVLR